MTIERERGVRRVARASARIDKPHCRVWGIAARHRRVQLDPFLGIDHFVLRVPMFPPHPHAGFCALTYLFDDSEGEFVQRDSLGQTAIVRAGDLRWTTAGRGIVHEEVPKDPGRAVDGLQIFVNLAAAAKRSAPSALHLDAAYVPSIARDGARARVVLGAHDGLASPLAVPTPVSLVDVRLEPGGRFAHRAPSDHNVIAYVARGVVFVGAGRRIVRAGESATFLHDGDAIAIAAGRHAAHVVFFGGAPLRERVIARGPFIMSSEREIEETFAAFRAGRMGKLDASF